MGRPELFPVKKVVGFDRAMLDAIDRWRRKQTPIPSGSEAIRELLKQALASAPKLRAELKAASSAKARARAEKAAGEQIERAHSDQPEKVKAERKRRLTKVPAELRKRP